MASGHIPRSFIQDLLAKVDIADIIESRIKLKKQGKNYSACCPFHNEKTPSFIVNPHRQTYKCFGCGVNGNVISFLIDYENLTFVEAVEELASRIGVQVPREQTYGQMNCSSIPHAQTAIKQDLYEFMASVCRYYQQQLKQSPLAIEYLKQRGLTGEIVRDYRIGYVEDRWDSLCNAFAQSKEQRQYLIDTGMMIEKSHGGGYDRFRGRIMFPIHDRRGRVIAFGGRIIGEGEPKYLNSPETALYQKSKEVYGLYEALNTNRSPEYLVIVEGYMDVVALAQYGVHYAVASLGTSTTGEQLQVLFRQSSTVVCCFDGDKAGKAAAWRAMENALTYLKDGLMLKFMFLPEGDDPDSFIRQYGKEKFEEMIADATPLSYFLFNQLLLEIDAGNEEGKAKLAATVLPLIDKLPTGILRQQLRNRLGKIIGVFDDNHLDKLAPKGNTAVKKEIIHIKKTPMRQVISLLVQNPEYGKLVPELTDTLPHDTPGLDLLLALLEQYHNNPHVTTAQLVENWRDKPEYGTLVRLANWDIPNNSTTQKDVFLDSLDKVFAQCLDQQIETLQAKERSFGLSDEEKYSLQALIFHRLS